ncbi:MAG TPA: hypothetical protein VN193_08115 [Candidatus Angelobacter sp.]|jgi:hypothetical protein|nr:hypothetical protein [Candidatus Angelobacter sp.]
MSGAAPDPGLCATCRHAAVVRGARSVFWMCRLSATDPSFDRYPRLPILQCRGYARGRPDEPEPATPPGDPATPPP